MKRTITALMIFALIISLLSGCTASSSAVTSQESSSIISQDIYSQESAVQSVSSQPVSTINSSSQTVPFTESTSPDGTMTQSFAFKIGYDWPTYRLDATIAGSPTKHITKITIDNGGTYHRTIIPPNNEMFTKYAVYFADVTFDGNLELLIPIEKSAHYVTFDAYVLNAIGEYVEAPTFKNIRNPVIDTAHKRILSQELSDQIASYGMYAFQNNEFEVTNAFGYQPADLDNSTVSDAAILAHCDETKGADDQQSVVKDFYVPISGGAIDVSDAQIAPYFTAGSFWDLNGSKWQCTLPLQTTYALQTYAKPASSLLTPSANEIYIFSDNWFMGSYRDGAWRNGDFTVAEIMAHSYKNYKQDGTTRKITSAGAFTEDGLDCIALNDASLLNPFAVGVDKNDSDIHIFKLPTIVTGAASKVIMTNYNAELIFSDHTYPLATNATFNPVPRPVQTKVTPNDAMKKAVRDSLDSLGLTNAPVNISQVYTCDLLGDGHQEQIIASGAIYDVKGNLLTTEDDLGKKYSGQYSICIVFDGKKSKIVEEAHFLNSFYHDSQTGSYDCTAGIGIILLGCFDVNHDGKYEILIDNRGWEGGCGYVFTLNENNAWTKALSSPYGM